jgi:hypothetical protein
MNGGPVPPIDSERLRRIFNLGRPTAQEFADGIRRLHGNPRVCLECETLGHICRACRAARFAERQRPPTRRERLRAWWRSTTLYAMNEDYPAATPLVFAAGVTWGAYGTLLLAWAL